MGSYLATAATMPLSPDTRATARRGRPHNVLANEAARAEQKRAALRAFVDEHGITIGELARRAGLTNANAFYNFLHGRSQGLSTATLLRICDNFPGTTLDHLLGRDNRGGKPDSDFGTSNGTRAVADPEPVSASGVIRSNAESP